MQAHKAYFMVRAQVENEADRGEFDRWYGSHHVPLAMENFRAEKAWRFWSRSDPSVHYAFYQFADMAALRERIESPDFKLLVDDFNQAWPRVPRTRDLIEAVQEV
jgi:hypothetical protein